MPSDSATSSRRTESAHALGFDRLETLGRGLSRGKFRAWRGDRCYLLSLREDPGAPEALRKELGLSVMLSDGAVPLAGIVDSGVLHSRPAKIYYVVKEYLTGRDYAQLFEAYQGLSTEQVRVLLFDLGAALGRIHRIAVPGAGDLDFDPDAGPRVSQNESDSWFTYLSSVIARMSRLLKTLPITQRVGSLTPAVLLDLWGQYLDFLQGFAPELLTLSPTLIHNDAIPANFMATWDTNSGGWRLSAVLDIDTMIGGDPEFDLVSLENWFELAPCKALVLNERRHLAEGYASTAPRRLEVLRLRRPYGAFRCINYLTFLLALDRSEADTDSDVESVEFNLQLASKLMQGGAALELF